MINAVIVDDSPEARTSLKEDLKRWCPDVHLVGEADSMKSGLSLLKEKNPDVVFLDIELGDGNGFSLLEQLGETTTRVIFTTGMDNFGIRAIKFSALDYLLKPVDPDELVKAVEKVKEDQRRQNISVNLKLLAEQMRPSASSLKRLALNSSDKVQVVNITDIIRCESERNYTTFFLKDKKQIVVTKTLKEYEELLEPMGFVRVHHSHLINLEHLKEFIKHDGGYALMDDNAHVPVSVRKREDLLKALGLS
ncbi:MAG TPA: LytTR family DNA-binding domain-containing protein [Bacteroidia bacterium]|jgi:two-component system LytT family response regulator|nr:LytTR family DNA-binding domain-containing protein [Bacteroidia bacterium]